MASSCITALDHFVSNLILWKECKRATLSQFNGLWSAYFVWVSQAVHFKNEPPCLAGIGSTRRPQFIKVPFQMQRHSSRIMIAWSTCPPVGHVSGRRLTSPGHFKFQLKLPGQNVMLKP